MLMIRSEVGAALSQESEAKILEWFIASLSYGLLLMTMSLPTILIFTVYHRPNRVCVGLPLEMARL